MPKNIETPDHVFFLTNEFSQWYPSTFRDEDGHLFTTCEQWMMFNKASQFGNDDIAQKILQETSPKEIKNLGRAVQNFDAKKWNACAPKIVTLGNIMKFAQNPELWAIMDATKDKVLVEAADYDSIWGIGLTAEQAVALGDSREWKGQNKLGKALMEAREFLREHPQFIVKQSPLEKRVFTFYDPDGQKTIRLNIVELGQKLQCAPEELANKLMSMDEVHLPYEPFVKNAMIAKSSDLLLQGRQLKAQSEPKITRSFKM